VQAIEREQNGVHVIVLEGEIDLETSPQLRTILRAKAQHKNVRVLLDFAGVTYVDSSGLATLLEFYQTTRHQGGRLVLAQLTKRVQNALEIVRLHEIFTIYPDIALAQEALLAD
jgi:anti-sigma B factor antagonist